MRTIILFGALIASHFYFSQKSKIPVCLTEKIEGNQKAGKITFPYKTLYKVDVKGKTLYELVTDYGKAVFVRMPTINYIDENCKTIYSSNDADWMTYRNSIKRLETLWARPLQKPTYDMATFLNKKRKFKVFSFFSDFPQFPLKEKQMIHISLKEGLQIIEKEKVQQSFKLIPRQKILYNPDTRKSTTAEGICNAILLEHDGRYWLLYAKEDKNFLLIETDQSGQYNYESKKATLVLIDSV